jgi:hypothetical protein
MQRKTFGSQKGDCLMVRCVQCPRFDRATRYCSFYKRTISLNDIHKQISCSGYVNLARRKWLLNAAHKEQNPQVKEMLDYQILGEKTK